MSIKFYVNNSPLFQKKADTPKTVSEIRELYKAKISNDAVFYLLMVVKLIMKMNLLIKFLS